MREFLFFLPITVAYLALKSTLLPETPVPDMALLVVFYLAARRPSVDTAAFAFALGYIEDAFTGGIIGSSAFTLVVIFLAVSLASKLVHFSTPAMRAGGAFAASLINGLLAYAVMRFTDPDAALMGSMAVEAVLTGIFAPAVMTAFVRVSAYMAPRAFKDTES